jgi:catechol 2,3-dioxygenase-like lactoylglutathione lyase family enzyme
MPEGTKIRAKILKAPGPAFGMIGLFELADPKPNPVNRDNKTSNIGEMCQVYYCDDVGAVHDKLAQGGHTVVCPPTFLKVGNRSGQREMVFRDPDGAMINLIEWDFETGRDPIDEL